MNDAAPSGAPRRRRWLVTVAGAFILLLGFAGLIGNIVRPEDSHWSDTYGLWGLVLSLCLDAVFIALGGYLLARGRRGRPPWVSVLSRVDAFATRAGERSQWNEYSPTKRRVAASLLTVEAAIVSFGASWLLLRSEEAVVTPWFIGGSIHLVHGVCLGNDHQPNEGCEVGTLARPPSHPRRRGWRKSAVGDPYVMSGARDKIQDQFTSGPLEATLSASGPRDQCL